MGVRGTGRKRKRGRGRARGREGVKEREGGRRERECVLVLVSVLDNKEVLFFSLGLVEKVVLEDDENLHP